MSRCLLGAGPLLAAGLVLLAGAGGVRAQDAKGEFFEKTGEELLARAFLHENDHLHGRLYISHVSALKRVSVSLPSSRKGSNSAV